MTAALFHFVSKLFNKSATEKTGAVSPRAILLTFSSAIKTEAVNAVMLAIAITVTI